MDSREYIWSDTVIHMKQVEAIKFRDYLIILCTLATEMSATDNSNRYETPELMNNFLSE